MLEKGMIEEGITRIGAEQEICLVDSSFSPVPLAMEALDELKDDHFTTELARFNLELNLDPQEFSGGCLSVMEKQLVDSLKKLENVLTPLQADYVLCGILPTIRRSDLTMENITPKPRYYALNDAISSMRGGEYEFRIQGTDELITKDNSVLFESCNTSFQVHYQVGADEFAEKYNWAQAIAGPILASSTNSPMLMGKRLWRETRIALFQQSTDTRAIHELMREQEARVLFGKGWVDKSVIEIFKEDVARYRPLISDIIEEDSMETLSSGGVPSLRALRLHNGTVYKWNRACYGITDGKPHLRIENRVFPSGPTVLDEMANTAFWLGCMHGMPDKYKGIWKKVDFDLAKTNFHQSAKLGMGTMYRWIDGNIYSAQDLLLKELIPIAEDGLKKAKINKKDINRYLDVIRDRVESGMSGSQWALDSFAQLKKKGTVAEAMVAITAATAKRQKKNTPVHKWKLASIDEAGSWINRYWRVDQIMSRDLITVNQDDLIDLVPNIMSWQNIRHVLVENDKGDLVGLVTSGMLVKYYSTRTEKEAKNKVTVKQIMLKKPVTIPPEMLTAEAISLLRKRGIGCLPVVKDKKPIGIVTEHDFVNVADHFLEEFRKKNKG